LIKENNNRYEGEWAEGKKNGTGKYYFLNKGQLLEGFWVNDINKTGKLINFDRENAKEPTQYQMPAVTVKNPEKIIEDTIEKYKNV
jgi:cytochrome b involved in lipid metabolism